MSALVGLQAFLAAEEHAALLASVTLVVALHADAATGECGGVSPNYARGREGDGDGVKEAEGASGRERERASARD